MKRTKQPTAPAPEMIDVDSSQFNSLIERLAAGQPKADDHVAVRQLAEAYKQLFALIGDKQTTLARLRKMLFGASTEKADKILGVAVGDDAAAAENEATAGDAPAPDAARDQPRAPGHGRRSADDYPGAMHQEVPHPTLAAGDPCPDCADGSLYAKQPLALVRFVGQAPLQATVYRLQRLRCCLCGKTFTAPAPAEAHDKYDPSAASMIGLMKYGSGLPFNRVARLQANCQVPLPASTQWEIVSGAATLLSVAYEELIRQAAQGDVLHNDDTTIKILELMGARAKKNPPADDDQPKRTGLFTSGVVTLGHCGDAMRRVALFFSGRKHAGENLTRVLRQRAAELDAPIHMCDGLSRNLTGELQTILANCLAHARRNFVDLHDRFPKECRYVIEALKVVYRNDKHARQERLSPDERLAYHQQHSQSSMEDLKAWLDQQFDQRLVEPNSALGEAIAYLLKRWEAMTVFLRVPGAPLDNNLCERALKRAILHRKNAYFYKTRRGALVGDIYMSLIYTCELNGVDALAYLTQLQNHADEVAKDPSAWMPWNYDVALANARQRAA